MMDSKLDIQGIVNAVKNLLSIGPEQVGLHEPCFNGNEWAYLKECLDTGWVSSVGRYVDRFEQGLSDYTGIKQAIAVVNGTAALHICLKLVGVRAGDEVIVPAFTFVATVNAVTYCGAIPHFADGETKTLGLDPQKLADYLKEIAVIKSDGCYNRNTGRPIRAVVPVHTFGHPVDLDPLVEVCGRFQLELIEDAAESLGSFYKERHTGNWGKLAALSFNGNKIVTTGGGGAILTNDAGLAKMAKHLTTTAKVPHKWAYNHDMSGYNYRLPNLNAALGCAQMEQLPVFIQYKRKLAQHYEANLREFAGIEFFTEPDFARSNYWLNTILLSGEHCESRDLLLEQLHDAGILARPAWTLMPKLPMFRAAPKMDLITAENLEQRIINLPSGVKIS